MQDKGKPRSLNGFGAFCVGGRSLFGGKSQCGREGERGDKGARRIRGRPPEPWSRNAELLACLPEGRLGRGAGRLQGGRPCECVRLLGGGEWLGALRNGREDKAALRAWPQVTGTACGSGVQGNDFQSLGFPSRESAFPRIRAGEEERQREMPFAPSRPGIRPSGGFVASLGF